MSRIVFLLVVSTLISATFSGVCAFKGVNWFPDGPVLMITEVTRSLAHGDGILPASIEEELQLARELSIEHSSVVWQDIVSLNTSGEYIPKHSLLSSILAVPFYFILGDLAFWVLQQLFLLGLIYSVFRLSGVIFGGSLPWSTLIACFLLSQTIFYIYSFSHDLQGCALLVMGLAIMQGRAKVYNVLGPIVMCLSVIIRPSYLILALLLSLFGRLDDSRIRRAYAILGLSIGLILLTTYNLLVWGNPVASAYTLVPGFKNGQQILMEHPLGFSWEVLKSDWWAKIFGLTGLVPVNLGFLLAPWVVIFSWTHPRRNFLLKLLVFSSLYMIYIYSYDMWNVSALGNRFLFPSIYLYLIVLVGYLGQFEQRFFRNFKRSELAAKSG